MADEQRSQRLLQVLEKFAETDGYIDPSWMSQDLRQRLHALLSGTRTLYTMKRIEEGMTPDQALIATEQQWPMVIFTLGHVLGFEEERARAFREMFGDD